MYQVRLIRNFIFKSGQGVTPSKSLTFEDLAQLETGHVFSFPEELNIDEVFSIYKTFSNYPILPAGSTFISFTYNIFRNHLADSDTKYHVLRVVIPESEDTLNEFLTGVGSVNVYCKKDKRHYSTYRVKGDSSDSRVNVAVRISNTNGDKEVETYVKTFEEVLSLLDSKEWVIRENYFERTFEDERPLPKLFSVRNAFDDSLLSVRALNSNTSLHRFLVVANTGHHEVFEPVEIYNKLNSGVWCSEAVVTHLKEKRLNGGDRFYLNNFLVTIPPFKIEK